MTSDFTEAAGWYRSKALNADWKMSAGARIVSVSWTFCRLSKAALWAECELPSPHVLPRRGSLDFRVRTHCCSGQLNQEGCCQAGEAQQGWGC